MRHRLFWAWLVVCLLAAPLGAQTSYIPPQGGGGTSETITVIPFGTIEADVLQDMLEEIVAEAAGGSGAPTDAAYVVMTASAGLSAEAVLGSSVIMAGTLAARPAAAAVGAGPLYYVTDAADQRWTRSTGAAWVDAVIDWSYVGNVEVTSVQLGAGSVTGTKIQAGSVDLSHLSAAVLACGGDLQGTWPNCTAAANSIALGQDTTNAYVAGVTANQGLLMSGSEAATLGLIDCEPGELLKRDAAGVAWECATDDSGGVGGTPGGADTQVQYNDAGAFGGDSGLTYNETTNVLTVSGGVVGNLTGNASTATALAANPSNCSAGNAPLGVDAAGAVEGCFDVFTQSEFTTHEADTTNVHGIADTSTLALTSDARFPTSDQKAALAGTGTPTGANPYVVSNDSRMTNARTPTAHASSHFTGGSDDLSGHFATQADLASVVSGLDPKEHVRAATTGELPASTYANGTAGVGATLTGDANGALAAQDGVTLEVGDRLLVKDQSAGLESGIYTVTTVGDGSNPFVLTRATDADTAAEVDPGMYTFVSEGNDPPSGNKGKSFYLTTPETITIGTTALSFVQFSASTTVTAGAGLTKTGETIDVGAGTCITVGANDVGVTAGCITTTQISGTAAITKAQISNTGTWETSEIPGITSAMITDDEIVNADIDAAAAIAESKLALNFATHSSANDPTANQKAALAGTAGSPSASNPYVTTEDVRLSDARTPTAHASSHAANGSDPLSTGTPVVGGDANAEGSANTYARSDHTHKLATKVRSNGSEIGSRLAINFVPGSNISLNIADDSVGDEVDVVITAADQSAPPTVAADISCVDEYSSAVLGTTCVETALDEQLQPYNIVYHCAYPANAGGASACDDLLDWSRVGGPLTTEQDKIFTDLTPTTPMIMAESDVSGAHFKVFGQGGGMKFLCVLADQTQCNYGVTLEEGRRFGIFSVRDNAVIEDFAVDSSGFFRLPYIESAPLSADCATTDDIGRRVSVYATNVFTDLVCRENPDTPGTFEWFSLTGGQAFTLQAGYDVGDGVISGITLDKPLTLSGGPGEAQKVSYSNGGDWFEACLDENGDPCAQVLVVPAGLDYTIIADTTDWVRYDETTREVRHLAGYLAPTSGTASPTGTDCDEAAEAGRVYVETDQADAQMLHICKGTSGWKQQGGASGGTVRLSNKMTFDGVDAANSAAFADRYAGTNKDSNVAYYADNHASDGCAYWTDEIPANLATTEAWKIKIKHFASTGAGGNARFRVQGRTVDDNESIDKAWTSLTAYADYATGAAPTQQVETLPSSGDYDSTLALVAGATLDIEVCRDSNHANDTVGQIWGVIGVSVEYATNN